MVTRQGREELMSVIDVFSAARDKVLRLSLCPSSFKFVLRIYLEICKRNHVNNNYIFNDKTSKEKLREK